MFQFGQLSWHLEEWANQGLDRGHPIPQMCQAELDDGTESCLDSTHLYGPFEDRELAEYTSEGYRLVNRTPPRDPRKLRALKVAVLQAHATASREDIEVVTEARGMAAIDPDSGAWHGRNNLIRTGGVLDPDLVRGLEKFL